MSHVAKIFHQSLLLVCVNDQKNIQHVLQCLNAADLGNECKVGALPESYVNLASTSIID